MEVIVENACITLNKKGIIRNFNCKISNHIYGLMGANGSGKTTLIRMILGIYKVTSGSIQYLVDDECISDNMKFNIGYLPQSFDAFKDLTLYEQMKYFAILKEIPKQDRNKEIDKVLKLTHLSNDRDKKCKELSGGMIRRLGIAQALMGEPDILVFDEPTAGLDPQERLKFREIINQLDFDIPIIISTHIVDDIYKQCSYILFLKDGKLIYSGLVNDLLQLLDNKVYSCHSSNIDNIKEEIYVVFNQNNIFRIVSKTVLKYDFLTKEEPTLDDAYVYLNS